MNRARDNTDTPSTMQGNLPMMLTRFIGRQREVADVCRLLASSRLVTLTGLGGCGKTRLALRVATEVQDRYADGIHWVELARLTDPTLVPQVVAKALHAPEQPGHTVIEGLIETLRGKQILLVLDNCEHVLNPCAHLVESLLTVAGVSVLATSREPLGARGEMRYPVAPMAVPPSNLPPVELGSYDAIQLFVERASAVVPSFELTAENAAMIADICRHLDGIPLAIELASVRMSVLTVEQIAARLGNRFALLGASPVIESRHRTLREAMDWSYDLLSAPEQTLLRRLSVFVGGCSLTTAEIVCAGDSIEREQVLDLLSSLVSKSLVVAQTLQRGEARYSLLETVRQYAQDKLVAAGEMLVIRNRHLECFLQLAEDIAPKLTGPSESLWLNRLEQEYDNIRAGLDWSLASGHVEAGLRIAISVYPFWTIHDYVEEGLAWTERLLAQADESVPIVVRANALAYASFLSGFRGNAPAQIRYGRDATLLAEAAGDEGKSALAWALAGQAYAARAAGDYRAEISLAKREIQLYRELGNTYFLGLTLSTTSFAAMSLGDYAEARLMLDEGLALLRKAGSPYRIAMALNFSGDLARCEQHYIRAQAAYEESISLLRELGALRDLASALHNLGHTCLHLGDVERARTLFDESMAIHLAQRNIPGVAECLIGFAALAVTCGLPGSGARLLAAATAIGGQRVATAWAATRMEYERTLARIRAALAETELQAEQTLGSAFSLEQAMECAHHVGRNMAALHVSRKKLDRLTPREREVAALIAQGKTNGTIAHELVMSKRTVESHISNILSKLGFTNRAQIVRWAIETRIPAK